MAKAGSTTIDITGQRFGKLVGIRHSHIDNNRNYWVFKCDCGQECIKNAHDIKSFTTGRHCGCVPLAGDWSGRRFAQLTVIKLDHRAGKEDHYRTYWVCLCDCGNQHTVLASSLTSGFTKSCGCLIKFEDITGQKFGKLTAIEFSHRQKSGLAYRNYWRCICECGGEK